MKDVTQIRVGKHKIGIVGLNAALVGIEADNTELSDEQIGNLLLEKLSKKNYIGSEARDKYQKAFLREYKKHLGETVPEETVEGLRIKVLGAGCLRCDRLERDVMDVLSECGILADLEHVRDINEIGNYGVTGTPALIINGQVKCVGKVPTRSKLKTWIQEASPA
jgi:small redox-active disulfide protein 2